MIVTQGAGRCEGDDQAFAHIYAQSKRVLNSNAAPFTRIQKVQFFSSSIGRAKLARPVDRGFSVSRSMRHPFEIPQPNFRKYGRTRWRAEFGGLQPSCAMAAPPRVSYFPSTAMCRPRRSGRDARAQE